MKATVFFDIDGTLAWRDPTTTASLPAEERELSPRPSPVVRDAIAQFVELGGNALLCTGRSPVSVHPTLRDLTLTGIVGLSGAYVEVRGVLLRDVCISAELLARVDEVLRAAHEGALLESAWGVRELRGGPEGTRGGTYASMRDAAESLQGGRVHKLVVSNAVVGRLLCVPELAQRLGVSRLDDLNSEVGMAQNTKQVGVQTVLGYLGDEVGTTYGFGDSENDLALFQAVDVPVAMGNASEEAKRRAKFVCGSVGEDGVAQGMRMLGLI